MSIMSFISLFFTLWFVAIILFCLLKPKIGWALFVGYFFLVPVIKLQIGTFSIGQKFLMIFLAVSFLVKYGNRLKSINYAPLRPFMFLFFSQVFLVVFQQSSSYSNPWKNVFASILDTLLFPMILYMLLKLEPTARKWIENAILISALIIVGYGLFLTNMPGINPYLMISLPLFGSEFNEAYALGYSGLDTRANLTLADGRLFGRISSVFVHPMQYGLVLLMLIIFVITIYRKSKCKQIISISFIFMAILTSGTRSPLGAIILTLVIILWYLHKIKYAIGILMLSCIVFFIIHAFSSELADYMVSIFQTSNKSSVQGSSIDMRIDQFWGCFDIIDKCFFTGKGYGWTTDYMEKYSSHPVLLSFESLVYVVLCNTGAFGILIWGIFSLMFLKYVFSIINKKKQIAIFMLFLLYISYSCITGEYGYMKYFMIFYVVTLASFDSSSILIRQNNSN